MFSARNKIGLYQRLEAYRRIVDHKNDVSESEDSVQSDSSSDQSYKDSSPSDQDQLNLDCIQSDSDSDNLSVNLDDPSNSFYDSNNFFTTFYEYPHNLDKESIFLNKNLEEKFNGFEENFIDLTEDTIDSEQDCFIIEG